MCDISTIKMAPQAFATSPNAAKSHAAPSANVSPMILCVAKRSMIALSGPSKKMRPLSMMMTASPSPARRVLDG